MLYPPGLLDALVPHLKDFAVGECLWAAGPRYATLRTCYSARAVPLRGGPGVGYHRCRACGSVRPQGPAGPVLFLRDELAGGEVQQDWSGFLYVSDRIAGDLDLDPWEGTYLEPVAVRNERPAWAPSDA